VQGDRIPKRSDGRRDLVVIGASAGSVEVLTRMARDLPADLSAAMCIVLHVAPGTPSMLVQILSRAGKLPSRPARDGEHLRQGQILVAPPDHHLAVEDSCIRLTVGPRENGHRPAFDVLFRSAARAFDGRMIGVVLSGARDDGAGRLAQSKANGGAMIVQDPAEAMYSAMPASAIALVSVDAIVPSALVAGAIVAMVMGADPRPPGRVPTTLSQIPRPASRSPLCVRNAGAFSPSVRTPGSCNGSVASGIAIRLTPSSMRKHMTSRAHCGRRFARWQIAVPR
jgi:two-component system chemotaxis response regulator CheB